jgi:hypothetical protein
VIPHKKHLIFPNLQLTRPAVVGIALLLRLPDSIFCDLAPLALPSRLKPRMAMVILSSFSTSLFRSSSNSPVWSLHLV